MKDFVKLALRTESKPVKEELGDILWYMAILMDVFGLTFEDCMEAVIAKLKKRFPEKFDEHQAVNRDLASERQALSGIEDAKEDLVESLATRQDNREDEPEFKVADLGALCSQAYHIFKTINNRGGTTSVTLKEIENWLQSAGHEIRTA